MDKKDTKRDVEYLESLQEQVGTLRIELGAVQRERTATFIKLQREGEETLARLENTEAAIHATHQFVAEVKRTVEEDRTTLANEIAALRRGIEELQAEIEQGLNDAE